MSDRDNIEQEIQAKGLTAPRITPEHIDATIAGEEYVVISGTTTTICALTLRNGYIVTGVSACASPENFDAELGRKIARENARERIWALEGYLLRERLHQLANEPVGWTFGQALEHIKRGGKVAREGWNGKGMHLYLWERPCIQEHRDEMATMLEPCIVMLTAQGKRQPGWLASQADMLASDWRSVD